MNLWTKLLIYRMICKKEKYRPSNKKIPASKRIETLDNQQKSKIIERYTTVQVKKNKSK